MKSEKVYIEYLLLKAQLGDQQAGEELLSLLQLKIKAFALKFMAGSSALEDCVQDALIKVHRKLSQLKAVKALHTWVYRITYSTCVDHLRRLKDHSEVADETSDDMSGYEQQLDIKSAIATLSEEQQVIIYLFYYEGFNVAEVAEVLGKPAGTIKFLLFEARSQIKSHLLKESNHEY